MSSIWGRKGIGAARQAVVIEGQLLAKTPFPRTYRKEKGAGIGTEETTPHFASSVETGKREQPAQTLIGKEEQSFGTPLERPESAGKVYTIKLM